MPRKSQEPLNLTTEEAKAKRIEEVARKKKLALESLAETEAMARDLGIATEEAPEPIETGNGSGDQERLNSILSEISNDGFWEAYRMVDGKMCKMGRFDMSAWPDHLDQLARDTGGGTITIQFKQSPGSQYIGQITRHFDPATYKRGAGANPLEQAKPESKSDETFAKFFEMMDRRDMQYKQELAEARRENSELMRTMMTGLMGQDPLRSLTGIKTILELAKSDHKSPLASVKEVFETIRILKGESTEPPSMMETLISKACDMLAPVLQASVGKKLPEPATPGANGGGTKTSGLTPQVPALADYQSSQRTEHIPNPGAAIKDMKKELGMLADQLWVFIEKGASPDTAASAIADLLTPQNALEFKPYTDDPNIADKLMAANEKLYDRKVWLVDFAKLMKEYIDEVLAPPEPEPVEENA